MSVVIDKYLVYVGPDEGPYLGEVEYRKEIGGWAVVVERSMPHDASFKTGSGRGRQTVTDVVQVVFAVHDSKKSAEAAGKIIRDNS